MIRSVCIGAIFLTMVDMRGAVARAVAPLVAVPFVGCRSDGQQGPVGAPKRHATPRLPRGADGRLTYYASAYGPGVLAPTGWRCFGLYGSSGTTLVVTPSAHHAVDFFGDKPFTTPGPAVLLEYTYGGTSGRWGVAKAIARYFPEHLDFIHNNFNGLEVGPLPDGPSATDVVHYETNTVVRFTTPPDELGQGTEGFLAPDTRPVKGFVALILKPDGPDLLTVDVRLPLRTEALTAEILDTAQRSARH